MLFLVDVIRFLGLFLVVSNELCCQYVIKEDESVYDVLRMANIERDFAEGLIPEFVLYWQENGSAQCSWSTKFLQYVKRQWARHSQPQTTGNNYGKQQGSDSAGRIRDRSIIDALSDRSWAS